MNTYRNITRRLIKLSVFWSVIHFAFAGPVFAQCNPAGKEFQVNTYIQNSQERPSVAGLTGGGFVVSWESDGQDGSSEGVYGQVFASSGNKVGGEFMVNTYTTGYQGYPSVAGLSGGGFVVTWHSSAQDGSDYGVYGQVFDSAGNKVGTEFRANHHTDNLQSSSSVAGLTGGGFVVTWHSSAQDGSGYGVYGQVFDGSGNKVDSEFGVNTYTTDFQGYPSVRGLTGGGFVVTWASLDQDGNGYGVYGQVFDGSGNKISNEFRVNTYTTSHQDEPSVVGLSGGGFVVAWRSAGQDGSDSGVYGQIFDSAGNKVGTEFRVNTYTIGNQWFPSVASLTEGGFAVTWMSNGQDGSDWGVYGQVFGSAGNRVGSEFRVNSYTNNGQFMPSVAGLTGGGFVVTWASYAQDGSDSGVYGQRYFCGGEVCKGELVVDFGAIYGLWHYDREKSQPWSQLNTVNPSLMTAVDIDYDGQDELVVAFPGYGLYTYDQTNGWTPINTVIPEAMIPFRNGIACDFGAAYGLWFWDQTEGWKLINVVDPDKMIAADIDGDGQNELIVSFVGYGLYSYNEASGWTQINSVIPNAMIGINLMK